MLRALVAVLSLSLSAAAFGQGAVLQGGPHTPGHVPQYVGSGSQAVIMDGGPASGGAVGVNPAEFGLTARGNGTPPYANAGTGPLGTNACDYDAPTTNATGYHYLCWSPNAQGGGVIAYGAGGTATPLPFQFLVNGQSFVFPAAGGAIATYTPVTTANVFPCWANSTGLLADCSIGAATLVGNPTVGSAKAGPFTLASLTPRGAPDANNDLLLIYDRAAGTFKSVTPGLIASSATAGVSSLCSLTGSVTAAQATACLNLFSSSQQGLVPASGGGSVNFLRADGVFAPLTPGGTNGQIQYNNGGALGGVSQVPISKGGTSVDNTGANTNDVLSYNGAGFLHSAVTSVITAACTASPGLCVTLFGYGDPTWWGGGTAVADNSSAINSALSATSQVKIPGGGTWLVRLPVKLNAGNRLECPGGATIMQGNAANQVEVLNFYTNIATGASLKGCTIDGNRSNNADSNNFYGVNVSTTNDVQILDNTIQNMPGTALNMAGVRPTVARNSFNNIYQIAIALASPTPNLPMYGKVYDNRVSGSTSHAIYLFQGDFNEVYDNSIVVPIALGGAGSAMNVTVAGTTASWVSGTNFAGVSAGMFLVANGGVEFQITAVVSNTQLTLASSGSLTSVPAAIGAGDMISMNNVSYNKVHGNSLVGGVTGGVVLSNESSSTENVGSNQIYGNYVFDSGAFCYAIDGNGAFSNTVVNDTQLIGNYCLAPGRNYPGGAAVAGIELYASPGRVNGAMIDGNYVFDPFTMAGGYWLTAFGQNNAVNVSFGKNTAKGFANGYSMNGYPTYGSLPVGAFGNVAYIADGSTAWCGDSSCTTWGTIVAGGGGTIHLNLWHNGSNWTLIGK
ncbi:right-handed parallel beta-helix repeat-containing protein [Bradyrhizobium brasilense]|nr:right-handed parallel beta-helix repeat-containing protein [Bradyrhizobium brasilense]